MDELEQLEIIALVSTLTTEINNYTGINDKTLAEFVLGMYEESKGDKAEFATKLSAVGGDFPDSFVDRMRQLIGDLHPKYRGNSVAEPVKDEPALKKEEPAEKLSVLTMKDTAPVKSDMGPEEGTKPARREENREYRDRSDRRDRSKRRSLSPDQGELDLDPILNKVYKGRVKNLTSFGAFVTLSGLKNKTDGLVHVSVLAANRVDHPSDVVSVGDVVYVKVCKIDGRKIGLSLNDVDQQTGQVVERAERSRGGGHGRDEERGRRYQRQEQEQEPVKKRTRLTSPERWEIRQLIASGVVNAADYPDLDEDIESLQQEATVGVEEDVEIEVKEIEPPFLAGQTFQSLELSPVRVVKAPDGSLNRAAINSAVSAKERREKKQKEKAEDLLSQDAASESRDNRHSLESASDPLGHQKYGAADPAWKQATIGTTKTAYGNRQRDNMTIAEVRKSLPVYEFRQDLINAIRDNQIIIVVGETGSGKTTQITQYLYEAGFAKTKRIGCTQPRRVAAVSVAKRVAEEVGCRVGKEVGYLIRFEDWTCPQTKIKYMTDGMLQREALVDPDMDQYSVLMLDEAHERTIATDILFALLKKAAKRRPDLRLVITSATLNAEKFSTYFEGAPIITIPGRTFPVEEHFAKEPEADYLEAAIDTVMDIHVTQDPGDILVFLTGQEEIDSACEILYERSKKIESVAGPLIILPVYSSLPSEMQSRIFDPAPPGSRKVVLATNIAETSITIDGVYYVVDPGFVKINAYDSKLGMDSLQIAPISQAQATQRAGRAGRTGPGKCYRLYTENSFHNEMLTNTVPEIQRQNLSHTILMLKAMGINDLLNFDFMDPPPHNTLLSALNDLHHLSAIDGEGLLTKLGRNMADFPMEPAMAKVLLNSVDHNCAEEILTIVAMLSVQSVFFRPKNMAEKADAKRKKFMDPTGDHLTMLNVYNAWKRNNCSKMWTNENFIQDRSMRRAQDVRNQLVSIMGRYKHRISTCGASTDIVRKVLCSGYFKNSAEKDPQQGYKTLIERTPVFMHPSSALFSKPSQYVIYHTLLLTSKEYMHCVTSIDAKWLPWAAPTFFNFADANKLSKEKKSKKIVPLYDRYAQDQDSWRLSSARRMPEKDANIFG